MAAYEYIALDNSGKSTKGILEADAAKQVRQQLRDQGMTPLEISEVSQKEKKQSSGSRLFQPRIAAADLALITRQLATLVQSGLPIESALYAVAEQCEKPRLRSMMMAVRSKVVEGYSLAEGLGEFPHVFDNLFCAMVAAGEKSGHLDPVLERLADYTEQRQHMKSTLMQAMLYPLILTVFAIGVVSILLTAVVPKVVGQFEHMGQSLPASTQFLISASDFLKDWGLVIVLVIIGLLFIAQQLLKKPDVRLWFDRNVLKLPLIGKVTKSLNTARFARTLSILSSSAVPLLEGMQIAGKVLANEYIKKSVLEASGKVREGAALKTALGQTKLFPPMMLHMIASGEKSGELEQMLARAADNQDREFETMVNVSLKVFEPILVAAMAGMVLFIVMAILQPILALNSLVGL